MKALLYILLILGFCSEAFAQNRIITGQVRHKGGGIIPATKISAFEAPTISTLTDAKGQYRLEIPPEVKHLVVSYTNMKTKTIEIGKFNTLNIVLKPDKSQTWRYGAGLSYGFSGFSVKSDPEIHYIDTGLVINMRNFSIHADLRYKINPSFDIQAVLEADLNSFDYTEESGNGIKEKGAILRSVLSFPLNYEKAFGKGGNYSFYTGLGPQINHLSYFKKWSMGLRVQTGVSLNNYGFNTRFYFTYDYTGGKLNSVDDNDIYPIDFQHNSLRLGILFYF